MSELFFSFLLILLPTQLGFHFWPSWSLVLGRRIDYLSPTLYLTDILIFIILMCWYVKHRKKFSIFNFQFPILKTVFFLGFIFLNIFFAANRFVAIYSWMKVLEFVGLGIYIVKTKPKFSSLLFPL